MYWAFSGGSSPGAGSHRSVVFSRGAAGGLMVRHTPLKSGRAPFPSPFCRVSAGTDAITRPSPTASDATCRRDVVREIMLFASASLTADRGAITLLGAYQLAPIVPVLQRTDHHGDLVARLDDVSRPSLTPEVARRPALDVKDRHHTLWVRGIDQQVDVRVGPL